MRAIVIYSSLVLLLSAALIGCAEGGEDTTTADAATFDSGGFADADTVDAPTSPPADARPLADSMPSGDAGSFMCVIHTDCVVAGECCFSAGGPGICVKGTVFSDICLPD